MGNVKFSKKVPASEMIAKSKTALIMRQPFFATLLMTTPLREDNTVKTFATNGLEIRYNASFAESLTQDEMTFVLAHETLHSVFHHMTRRGSRNPNRWNIAADYVINGALCAEHIGTMPKCGLRDDALVARGKGTTEGVYALLPEDTEEQQAGDEGGALDEVQDCPAEQAEAHEAEMRTKLAQAVNAAKMQGKLSKGIARIAEDLSKSRKNWKEVLRNFLTLRAKTDLTYARPKRRFLADDVYLPSVTGERVGSIAIAIDCSGSINAKILGAFETEVRAIFEDTCPESLHVIYFDSQVLGAVETFQQGDAVKLSPKGGGGTAFSPIFAELAKLPELPAVCVVLTDLCCSDFGNAPEYPVLWASNDRQNGNPFGEVVDLRGAV